jgi:general secretion pathway protein G
MTLIEIMIVVTIMAAIMGVVGWFVIGQSTKADIELTKTQVRKVKTAVEAYRLYYKKYPDKLEDLISTPDGNKLMDEIPKDPWGNDYIYEKSSKSAKVFSAGPDGSPNNDDDIVETISE